jgi:hypothetical protein
LLMRANPHIAAGRVQAMYEQPPPAFGNHP